MRFYVAAIFSLILLGGSIVHSQDGDPETQGQRGFWEAVIYEGRFAVRLDQISCVSQHEYLIDGGVKVYECTVDTVGGMTARFYYIEPAAGVVTNSNTFQRINEVANKVSNRTGSGDADRIVTKHYPDTTHAKTAEYRLRNKNTVSQIYRHVYRVWAEERGNGRSNRIVVRDE